MSTKERLAKALETNNAPNWMIANARNGVYDDFESLSATPIGLLVADCRKFGLNELAQRAIDGEFDSTKEEADAWYRREGKNIFSTR